jgi:hypothetical protein
MIDSRHATDITNAKSCTGADCGSNHYMMKVIERQRIAVIAKTKGQKDINYNTDKLKICLLCAIAKRR